MKWKLGGLFLLLVGSSWRFGQSQDQGGLDGATSGVPRVFIAPDDARLDYSEYVDASIQPDRASFGRPSVIGYGQLHSPGTRVSFMSDASRIRVRLDYKMTGGTSGAGTFRLEVDGQLLEAGFGSDTDQGEDWYTLLESAVSRPRRFSLIFPYVSDVDFLGLELTGGQGLVGAPPPRPSFLYVAYGDSITQGFDASTVTESYPYLVGVKQGWSVTNMGFSGRKVTATDGAAVGALGGDLVTVAIGINDYIGEVVGPTALPSFRSAYQGFLDNLRSSQPTVPVFAITPTWSSFEGIQNSMGLTVENYRQEIRSLLAERMATDSNLHVIEGLSLVPAGTASFPDGLHPGDAGFDTYASSLIAAFATADGTAGRPGVPALVSPSLVEPASSRFGMVIVEPHLAEWVFLCEPVVARRLGFDPGQLETDRRVRLRILDRTDPLRARQRIIDAYVISVAIEPLR